MYISIWILPVGYKNIYVGKGNTYVCMFEHIPIKTQEDLQKKKMLWKTPTALLNSYKNLLTRI